MISCDRVDYDRLAEVWKDIVKISKLFLWMGTGAASVGGLLYGFGLISKDTSNKYAQHSIKVI